MGEHDVPARPVALSGRIPSDEMMLLMCSDFESWTWSQHWIEPVLHSPAGMPVGVLTLGDVEEGVADDQ